ncbi:MAG: GatB/YqeY domain-containing protein [Alphaproteobacteria bacterium]|nr:GatB/YqeY domain-containing protein [Alphaproteobacteria bacterium]
MLRARFSEALKDAMRAKDAVTVSTVRMMLAALKDRDIAARGKGNAEGIADLEILQMLQSMIKQRRESIEMYAKGGRQDLVDQETAEIAVVERVLPQPLDEAAAAAAIAEAIRDAGAAGIKDMGRVMALLRERFAGRMDFTRASAMVKQALS